MHVFRPGHAVGLHYGPGQGDDQVIKLRPGLAQGLSANKANQDIIRAVVKGIEAHDIIIIADEVEDASDLATLWQCGVKLVTGDFLNEAPQVVGQ